MLTGDFCHSYQPWAGTRHRRDAAAFANDPFSRTDSARALIIRIPILTSLAQLGTSPHVSNRSWRTGAGPPAYSSVVSRGARVRTTGACLLGARL